MPPTRERRWWTSEEDDILKHGIQLQCGNVQNWNDIAELLTGRTNKDCRKRWSKIQLDIRKGPWTPEEDERLQQAVQKIGPKWSQVATMVQLRNADQCAKRWQHVLGPGLKHSPWTSDEDRKLLEAMTRHGNNWKQIGLSDLPDRSTHDIRNRSLLLERRSRKGLARTSVSAHPLSSNSHNHNVVGDKPHEIDNDDDDDETCDGGSGYESSSLTRQHQPQDSFGTAVTQQETIIAPGSAIDSPSIMHPQHSRGPVEIPQDTALFLDPNWTGATGQVQAPEELPTPSSDNLSWLDPFEVSGSNMAGSQPYWWTKSSIDERCFQSSAPFDTSFLYMPESSDVAKSKGDIERIGVNAAEGNEEKGSVTVTLNKVDPNVAQEIMGSMLKHSGCLKIRCIVNGD